MKLSEAKRIDKFLFTQWAALMRRFAAMDRICSDPVCVNRECVEARHAFTERQPVLVSLPCDGGEGL